MWTQFISLSCLALQVQARPPSWGNKGDHSSHDDEGLVIETTSGQLHGFINESTPDVRQWLGVPYAEPPLGHLRFSAAEAKKAEPGLIYTRDWQPSCMQQWGNSSSVYTEVVLQFLTYGSNSEDCLYLNIWAPAASKSKEKLPVYVYIPGGGFTSGGAHSWYKVPDQLVQARQDAVFVIMNVEWTRDNIAAFGGDPERINLWGQSAGGASVDIYSYAWHEDPIVTGFSADSGTVGIAGRGSGSDSSNFTYLAGLVGCGNLSASAELNCMRNVPAGTLENTLSAYLVSDAEPSISFSPVVDDVLVFSDYAERAASGQVAQAPMIIGNNNNEGAGFVPFSQEGPGEEALQQADLRISCGIPPELSNREAAGLTTYRYIYSGNFSNVSPLPWMGAYHSSELPIIFGTHYEYRGNSTPFEWEVAHTMQDLWLSFAADKSKAPHAQLEDGSTFSWPAYSDSKSSTVEFASGDEVTSLVSGESPGDQECPS
ncbi:chlorogenic acid esterase precursor [Hortaea werneckii]|nr:chlorogenic acid esterase precursor [Hortaea werneckii]KAI6822980.1 chlorogenic acid esterase precursor [Hortaea werneckii]KAI6916600.1 chlorogenic acid esterase precursor [Hortaea werneckii]KAI6931133.1 chlorogenic acid esterase precursor [Hortaea werneckii]KAI6962135.1 chlorogenic acid esterase precursor [Hortaea werneckii]